MDIEQLRLVLDLVKELADGALVGFLLYLFVVHIFPYFLGIFAVWCTYKFLSRWVDAGYSIQLWEDLAKNLNQPLGGYRYDWVNVKTTHRLLSSLLKEQK